MTKTRKEVANEYRICTKTLTRWFEKGNLRITKYCLLTPADLIIIYDWLGNPNK